MPSLPTGTVTFLFTDVEGSTRLLHELGAKGYGVALDAHRRVVRAACAANGGVEVDTQGDAFFVAFPTAVGAVAAAAAISADLGQGPILVRAGIHTGTPQLAGAGYVGADVHLGARIAAAGHGGQVLLSEATRAALEENLELLDLGEHRLKDFEEPVAIHQLGLEHFPPLRTISNTNLPRPASAFVGRRREIEEITVLLRDGARLLTLTGPGGSGKSRLSIEAATELIPEFKAGVFWIPLASLQDESLVLDAVAQTLGAKHGLAEHIGEREMLLVLDNLEQVIGAAAELAGIVERCPRLRLLVTSRELLRVRGEVEYSVPPLADGEAVELFSRRSGLAPDATIEDLCRRLENLPLALELAAARARLLSPRQILERLSGRLDLLKGGRDADPRQQTLRAAIEWSHELLDADEQGLFARLAVFHGGATLDALESVLDAGLDTLQALVDKSLLRRVEERFVMLETIREFALERLELHPAAGSLRLRHAEYFLDLAEGLESRMFGPTADAVNDLLEAELPNIRAALDRFETAGDIQRAMRLAGALTEFWDQRAHHREALARFSALLSASAEPTEARAKALDGGANMALLTGDSTTAWRWQQEALDTFRSIGSKRGVASALWGLGYMRTEVGDHVAAEGYLNESVELLREIGDDVSLMWITRTLAHNYYELGDVERARPLYEESLRRARAAGDLALQAHALGSLASVAAEQERRHEAATLARASLGLIGDARDPMLVLARLVSTARILARLGHADVAARLLAHTEARQMEVGAEEPWVARTRDQALDMVRAALDAAALEAARVEGRRLSPEAALGMARATLGRVAGLDDC